ncbi:monofunctional biosynthetic peptidoglycan transglycosylase [Orbaceae bacterium ESL0727]|nr:monofunctional biosynthetic peptidoglycan transglycosylase [Orbaceae bacterium ESL0727]
MTRFLAKKRRTAKLCSAPKGWRRLGRLIAHLIIGFIVLSIIAVLLLRFINPFGTMLMLERKITHWDTTQQRIWQDYDHIADNIKIAVIASEDQNFATHFGFDFNAINRAIDDNQKRNKIRGASTLTQQVAKNIFLWPARSWVRKGLEAWFTLWIELLWSKERILEIYLNSAEWGDGIFGIEAASRHYFNVSANQLTPKQASLLAAMLPNPLHWTPSTPFVQRKAAWIRVQMANLGGKHYLQQFAN